jgi:septal ring factor EnvC (AmiA/AmiB activator)
MDARSALILVTFGTLSVSAPAQQVTEIYKCVDEAGRPLYTSDKKDTSGRKCELVSREVNVSPVPAPAAKPAAKASPSNFPKESPAARAGARERQREVLEKELTVEQDLLAQARKELSQQEAQRSGEEKNYAKVLERLQPFKDKVEVHEKNIEALRRELANLKR